MGSKMIDTSKWDWEKGVKVIHKLNDCAAEVEWLEEPYASPDGEQVAALAKMEEGYGVCVNGKPWEQTFDNAWYLRFSPDGRLTCIVSTEMEWTLAVDGEPWPETYGYIWNTLFSRNGEVIAAAVQQDGTYGMSINGEIKGELYETASEFTLSPTGNSTAAVVQTVSFAAADIYAYQQGCYSVAINGQAWDKNFVNTWTPTFDPTGNSVAAQMRTSLYDYGIVVDGKPWNKIFPMVWNPAFHPVRKSVSAPVRLAGKWGMAEDEQVIWDPRFFQLWHQQYSHDGSKLYAICAPRYGIWTIIENDYPWPVNVSTMLTDLTISPDGQRAAAAAKEGDKWTMMVDEGLWSDWYDMIWNPVFSPDSKHLACKVEMPGRKRTVVIDGKPFKESFTYCWEPVFSPDSEKVLIRAVQGGIYKRIVAKVNDF